MTNKQLHTDIQMFTTPYFNETCSSFVLLVTKVYCYAYINKILITSTSHIG